jgi:uncharacterized protein
VSDKGYRPQRTCLGCGGRDDRDHLIRLAVEQGRLVLERHRGRGGYLHERAECRRQFIGRKGLYRAFRLEISRTVKANFIKELESRERE